MKRILELIDNISVATDESVEDIGQRNYIKNVLSDLLNEIRGQKDILEKQKVLIQNYTSELNRVRYIIKGLGNSYKYLISNMVDDKHFD